MKQLILMLAIAAWSMQSQAQTEPQPMDKTQTQTQPQKMEKEKVSKQDVPSAVMTAFTSTHASVTDVEWSKVNGNYVAEFDGPNKMDVYVSYDHSGKLIRTKEHVADSALPSAMMAYIQKNYGEDEARKAYKITEADGTVSYKAKIKGNILMFDSNGNFLRSEKEKPS